MKIMQTTSMPKVIQTMIMMRKGTIMQTMSILFLQLINH